MEHVSIYDLLMILTFIIGYFFITIEHLTHINKTSIALIMAIVCWVFQFANKAHNQENNLSFLAEHLSNISQVIFFLLGALTIVEMINVHKGFQVISNYINVQSKKKLFWLIGFITFFLSAILDNLTTTIIMVTLVRRLISEKEDRLLLGGAVVIAANAGGAWTPIGDVTTTMLWIGGQLSTFTLIKNLFLPSLACAVVAFICLSWSMNGTKDVLEKKLESSSMEPRGQFVFWLGLASLIFVPIFKLLTGLPPFMGMIFGLAIMWLCTDIMHRKHPDREHLRVPAVITKIDVASVLFFLGILLCIDALQTAELLNQLARWMDKTIGNPTVIATTIGLVSAVIDNVPLVAAAMGMYDLVQYPPDSYFWSLIAYAAGTGGSILVIGSAAGVAFMGLENVEFFWYFRRIGIPALIGYFVGIGVYMLTCYFC